MVLMESPATDRRYVVRGAGSLVQIRGDGGTPTGPILPLKQAWKPTGDHPLILSAVGSQTSKQPSSDRVTGYLSVTRAHVFSAGC